MKKEKRQYFKKKLIKKKLFLFEEDRLFGYIGYV